MRTLTITRTKSLVGRNCAVKLYIEDRTAPETVLLGIPCRLLGRVINGESKWFSIPEEMITLFALCEGNSEEAPDEVTTISIPAGNTPVRQIGICKKSSTDKTIFFFDSEASAAKRTRRRIFVTVAAIAVFVTSMVVAIILTAPLRVKRETFRGEGYSITLPEEFFQVDYTELGYEDGYRYEDTEVAIAKIPFHSAGGATSAMEYAVMYRAAGLSYLTLYNLTDIINQDGLVYYTYNLKASAIMYTERIFFYESADAIWLVHISVLPEDFDRMEDEIMRWAKSFRVEGRNASAEKLARIP